MHDERIYRIIELGLALDKIAFEVYGQFSKFSYPPEVKQFWMNLCNDEKEHVVFWNQLLKLSQDQILPQVFDRPEEVLNDLKEVHNKALDIRNNVNDKTELSTALLYAYRLEIYLLHPAIEVLFHYGIKINKKSPEDNYEDHINNFIVAFNKYGKASPELELLGETLKKLWKENRELAYKSFTDGLTSILNRRGFLNIVKPISYVTARNNMQIAIFMIDIDNFKKINDTYGHLKGDDVLRDVALTIKNSVRSSDIVGRYGGEEFIVFLSTSVTKDTAFSIADKIRNNIIKKTKDDIPVTVSIGVANGVIKNDDRESELMKYIKEADEYLYKAKKTGKNKVVKCDM